MLRIGITLYIIISVALHLYYGTLSTLLFAAPSVLLVLVVLEKPRPRKRAAPKKTEEQAQPVTQVLNPVKEIS